MEKNRPKKLCQWNPDDMKKVYHAAKLGQMSISNASKYFHVPRMSLSDRLNGKVSLEATMGAITILDIEEEIALISYITYMAARGFSLSVAQTSGFAWCIAKEHNKVHLFSWKGPSDKWWRGFKSRHPEISLRRPDQLDRGRAAMGNINGLKDYFQSLKNTLESNQLTDKPERIYNCEEAGLSLNKHSCCGSKTIQTCPCLQYSNK